jgi:cystathionine gamma-synthase
MYEDLLFPGDAMVLERNSATFSLRVRQCSATALALVQLLTKCPFVQTVYYPKVVPTAPLYERYRRPDGGYGYLLSILFSKPASAVVFYNSLDICKGPNVGTNFSLALPYAQLSHVHELDWAESQGVPKHIVRISVGLEAEETLIARIKDALQEVQRHESLTEQ